MDRRRSRWSFFSKTTEAAIPRVPSAHSGFSCQRTGVRQRLPSATRTKTASGHWCLRKRPRRRGREGSCCVPSMLPPRGLILLELFNYSSGKRERQCSLAGGAGRGAVVRFFRCTTCDASVISSKTVRFFDRYFGQYSYIVGTASTQKYNKAK